MTALAAALALAGSGYPVFPCNDDKSPACARGFHAASRDPDTIRALFANGAPLIGVPTGAVSGVDVLDLDPRHGSDSWWKEHAVHLEGTRAYMTRSGGMHYVFRHAPGLRSSVKKIGPGLDVRGDGGYVIHWPSAGCGVWQEASPAEWPAWLLEQARSGSASAAPDRDPTAIAPPSAAAVVDLLARLPNPVEADRDHYARVMLAAAGCVQALGGDDDGAIGTAAVAWAERWEGGSHYDEAEKWDSDWSRRSAPLAGWQSLQAVAAKLIPGYRDDAAAADFAAVPASAAPPSPARTRLRILTPGQCEGVTARPYVVKGLLAAGDVGCLFGPPGAGKSLLAPLLAYRVAQGVPFFGLRARPGPVLYVAAEDESGMERRVQALLLAHGAADGFGLVKGVSDLLNAAGGDLAGLLAEVEQRRPSLIVIDTLAMAFPGLIENDADGMGRVVAVARQLAQYGAAVLLVHHDTKARDGTPRGHSLLNGALDMAIALEPRDQAGIVRGRLTKNRNGSCDLELAFRIGVTPLGVDEDGDPVTAARAVELIGDAEVAARPPRLSPGQAAAVDALQRLMETGTEIASDGKAAVPEAAWLDVCANLSAGGTTRDKLRCARSMRSNLAGKGLVEVVGDMVRPSASARRGNSRGMPESQQNRAGNEWERLGTPSPAPVGTGERWEYSL